MNNRLVSNERLGGFTMGKYTEDSKEMLKLIGGRSDYSH